MYLPEECGTPDSVVGTNILLDNHYGDRSDYSNNKNSKGSSSINSTDQEVTSDQLLQLFHRESSSQYAVSPNYLHSCILIPPGSSDQGVSEKCRRRTCEWMYDICDYFRLNREVVAIALFYVDRYFTITFGDCSRQNTNSTTHEEGRDQDHQVSSTQRPVTRREFQLVALTSLYIAIKTHGEARREDVATTATKSSQPQPQSWNRLKFNLTICASISRHQFTSHNIEECECTILRTLQWRVNPIVPSGILIDSLVNLLPSSMDCSMALYVYDCAKYLAELSVSVPALSLVYRPSIVAYASVLYALDTLDCGSSAPLSSTSSSCTSSKYFSKKRKSYYQELVKQASLGHLDNSNNNEEVEGAKKILLVICPNLRELFPTPSVVKGFVQSGPKSPTSVGAQQLI